MTKKKNSGDKRLSAQALQIEILKFLLAHPKKNFSARQITQSLRIDNNADSAEHALRQLAQLGTVIEQEDERFSLALDRLTTRPTDEDQPAPKQIPRPAAAPREQRGEKSTPDRDARRMSLTTTRGPRKMIEGRVDMIRTGAAYIVSELLDTDVYIHQKHLGGAMHGDMVRVLLFSAPPARRSGMTARKPEGEIVAVLKRANEFFIGTLKLNRQYALFVSANPNVQTDVYIPLEACGEAQDGDHVVIRITDWQEGKGRLPIGKVTQALGKVGGSNFEMNKILIGQGFELTHSDEAKREAAAIPDVVSGQEIARRRDFRDTLTFTIDPEDAKDFDDALSIKELEDGNLEIGVHIADVTHYLKPDSAVDREAFQRSTSVYLVDRVCPMLPEKLSNHLCSLVPHADRLTFSAVFVFDPKGKIVSRWFGKTVIHSAHRFSYEQAQTILENQPTEALLGLVIFPKLDWAIRTMDKIGKKMRVEREKNGAIGFETDEVRFRLAEDGTPIEAYVKERKDTNLLIEDFMLLANKEVALYIEHKAQGQAEIPFVYRIHDLPDASRVADFARFAAQLGFPMKVDTPKQIAQSFNSLMRASRENDRLKLLEPLAIRTMAKAIYSTENIGHYGLGFSHYSHFTSPIRRYSDVLAHRILERNLDGQTYRMDKSKLEELCKHVSLQEKKAADAERESIKYKQVEFIKSRVGEVFEGIISGFLERGFFVELPESKAEGLVEFKYLADAYTLEEGNLQARGRRTKHLLRMGDRVQVRVTGADLQKRQIEMELIEKDTPDLQDPAPVKMETGRKNKPRSR